MYACALLYVFFLTQCTVVCNTSEKQARVREGETREKKRVRMREAQHFSMYLTYHLFNVSDLSSSSLTNLCLCPDAIHMKVCFSN